MAEPILSTFAEPRVGVSTERPRSHTMTESTTTSTTDTVAVMWDAARQCAATLAFVCDTLNDRAVGDLADRVAAAALLHHLGEGEAIADRVADRAVADVAGSRAGELPPVVARVLALLGNLHKHADQAAGVRAVLSAVNVTLGILIYAAESDPRRGTEQESRYVFESMAGLLEHDRVRLNALLEDLS